MKSRLWYFILLFGVFGVSILGYLVFRVYPTLSTPTSTGLPLMGLAIAAGVAAFFSPCSFPLLITLLSRRFQVDVEHLLPKKRSLVYAFQLALGSAIFLMLVGILIAAGGVSFISQFTFTSQAGRWLRVLIGALLFILGLAQIGLVRIRFGWVANASHKSLRSQVMKARKNVENNFFLFGFLYILAGFG